MRGDKGKNLIIEDWMFDLDDRDGKRLTDTALHLYALIYGFSKHGAGEFFGSREYIASRLRISPSSVKNAFKQLTTSGLIRDVSNAPQGSTLDRKWVVTEESQKNKPIRSGSSLVDFTPEKPPVASRTNLVHEPFSHTIIPVQSTQNEGNNISGTNFTHEEISQPKSTFAHGQDLPDSQTKSNSELSPKSQLGTQGIVAETKDNTKFNTSIHPFVYSSSDSGAVRLDYVQDIKELISKSPNKRAGNHEVVKAYDEAIAKGYTPERIAAAYERYIATYKQSYSTPQYIMRLDKFLRDSSGLSFYAPKPKQHAKAISHEKENAQSLHTQTLREYLCENDSEYEQLVRAYRDTTFEKLRETKGMSKPSKRSIELQQKIDDIKERMALREEASGGEYSDYLELLGEQHVR